MALSATQQAAYDENVPDQAGTDWPAEKTMTGVDLLFAVGVLFFVFYGYLRGAVRALLAMGVGLVALCAAAWWSEALHPLLHNQGVPVVLQSLLAPVLMFALVDIGLGSTLAVGFWLARRSAKRAAAERAETAQQDPDGGEEEQESPAKTRSPLGALVFGLLACVYGLMALFILELQTFQPQVAAEVRGSRVYSMLLEPWLRDSELPALAPLQLANEMREDPELIEAVQNHPQLASLRDYQPLKQLAQDATLRAAVESKDFDAVWNHEGVQKLLNDEEFARMLESVDLKKILDDVRKQRQ